jgi:hypothetical protein
LGVGVSQFIPVITLPARSLSDIEQQAKLTTE